MDITAGTFSLNNLFGRWNLYVEVPEARTGPFAAEASPAIAPPRDWLEEPPHVAATRAADARAAERPDVRIVLEGDLVAGGIKWRTNPASGKVVFRKGTVRQHGLRFGRDHVGVRLDPRAPRSRPAGRAGSSRSDDAALPRH